MRFIAISSLVLLLTAFVMLRLVKPLAVGPKRSALLSMPVLTAFALYPLLAWADMAYPIEIPRGLMITAVWAFMTALFFFPLLSAADVLRLPLWAAARLIKRRPLGPRWTHLNNIANGLLLLAVGVTMAVGEYEALRLPDVREITIELPHYPAGAEPLRVALLADLHADCVKTAPFLRSIVERTNALGADAILIAGDFADGRVAKRGKDVAELHRLHAPLGVYGVSGNHEYYSGNGEWQHFLTQQGIRMLNNESVPLGPVVLAGVPDIAAAHSGAESPDLARALRNVPRHAAVVLLAHQPKFAEEAALYGVDLQLSGHTHGGLIRGLDALLARFNSGFVAGLYQVSDSTQLYVSRGTSLWTGDAVRLGVPAEITLITLRGAQ